MQKATAGQPVTHQHGNLLITTSVDNAGLIGLYVTDGVNRLDQLTKSFTDRAAAAAWYRHIAQAAEAGKPVRAIEWEIQALIDAAVATDVEQVAEAINADGADYLAAETAVHNRLVAERDAILADADPNWRANLRAEVKQAAVRQNEGGRLIRPTKTRTHLKPLTAVELDLIRMHVNGVVTTRPGQSWTVLRAIHDRIGGTPTYRPGTRIIASLTFDPAQLDGMAQVAA